MKVNVGLLYKLLQSNSNIAHLQDFLKSKKLPSSGGSWANMFANRIEPALGSEKITLNDLFNLLRESEEHGSQHVFLYKCSKSTAQKICTQPHLESALKSIGATDLLQCPRLMEFPAKPTIVDARLEINNLSSERYLVIKMAETRLRRRRKEEEQRKDGTFAVVYEYVEERACNIARLSSSGILELRIASKSNNDQYTDDLNALVKIIAPFIDVSIFHEVSLGKVKDLIADEGSDLSDIIRVSKSGLCNSNGTKLLVASGDPLKHLIDDKGAITSVASFRATSENSYCEHSNIWFVLRDNEALPSKPIHVLISGKGNEYSLGAKCSKLDYEYVLDNIWELNKPVSQ